jgi:hypothetical protein
MASSTNCFSRIQGKGTFIGENGVAVFWQLKSYPKVTALVSSYIKVLISKQNSTSGPTRVVFVRMLTRATCRFNQTNANSEGLSKLLEATPKGIVFYSHTEDMISLKTF